MGKDPDTRTRFIKSGIPGKSWTVGLHDMSPKIKY